MKKICFVVGARPNFMKISCLIRELKKRELKDIEYKLIHTGQHYDENLSKIFFEDLKIEKPGINLSIGSGSHCYHVYETIKRMEREFNKDRPHIVIASGDVNSVLGTSIVTAKMMIKFAHVEAGIRLYDRTIPEETNRLVADVLADYNFCLLEEHTEILFNEGIPRERIFHVGDLMIDSIIFNLDLIKDLKIKEKDFALMTIHRAVNTDHKENLEFILSTVNELARNYHVIFPIHPRTINFIKKYNFEKLIENIDIRKPMGYLEFLSHMVNSRFVITDSGGIQTETTFLEIPCLTMKETTGHMNTVRDGTNVLIGYDRGLFFEEVEKILKEHVKKVKRYHLWDGKVAERIIDIILEKLKNI